jgi:tetratricopeptide (TPR) repeat protein
VILNEKHQTDSAIEYFQKALQADPDYAEASNNLGIALAWQNEIEQAMKCFVDAINSNPQMHNAYFNLAGVHSKIDMLEDAADLYRKAIQINSHYPEAHNNLAITLNELGLKKQAIEEYKKAIQLKPDFCHAYTNIAIAETQIGQLNDALQHAKKAIELSPEIPQYHYNLANALKAIGNCQDALKSYDRAISFKPDYPEAIWNRAITLLLSGDLAIGFEQYKKRRDSRLEIFTYPNKFDKPIYTSGSLAGKRLLVHWEQGLGDSIQFVRFLPLIKKLGAHIIYEERKALIDIFKNIDGIDELVTHRPGIKPEVDFDMYAPLMDLPAILGVTTDSIPAKVPYIRPDKQKSEIWKQRLKTTDLKVGIVWAGKPKHGNDHNRSCSLADFAPLAAIEGVKTYSLQKGDAARQIQQYKAQIKVENLGEQLDNFTDTAAAIDNLDLIISVDTSVLHLAGAMGKKTFALIPYHPDWRWMLSTDKSPWYPTMKIFRQREWGKWNDVFETIQKHITKFVITNLFPKEI